MKLIRLFRLLFFEELKIRYKNHIMCNTHSCNFKLDYIRIVKDMIDFDTSISIHPNAKDSENLKNEKENVSAYTIRQIEQALKGKRTWTSWRDHMKSKYDNFSEQHLDALFNHWNESFTLHFISPRMW